MIILALDTSAVAASVAVLRDETPLFSCVIENGNTHSETLLPAVESALKVLGLTVKDIDLFALSAGPGSFTGVRIAAATIKGLAFGSGKPCVGVSTLEALAYQLRPLPGLYCPVMNARRSQVYTALFSFEKSVWKRLWEDQAISTGELKQKLSGFEEPVYFTGDGYGIAAKDILLPTIQETPAGLRTQNGVSVGQVALMRYRAGDYTDDATLKATYLRPCQAERERLARESAGKS